jgi:hypothetical protein
MRIKCLVVALASLAVSSVPAVAVDLTTIDRHIAQEPSYQTKLPKYCLLVIGPAAKTRIWLVIDSDALYIDRNGNGNLTESNKRVEGRRTGRWLDFYAGPVLMAYGDLRHLHLRIRDFQVADGKCTGMDLVLDGKRKQFVGFDEANPFRFAQRPEQAPVIHLEGPLMMKLYGEPKTLLVGQETELNISIGTPGIGRGSFCALHCCTVLDCKVSPIAEIEFPGRDSNHVPLKARVRINDD